MIARLPFIFGGALALAMLLTLALARMPQRPPLVQLPKLTFEQRYVEPPALARPIRTIPITRAPEPKAEPAPKVPKAELPPEWADPPPPMAARAQRKPRAKVDKPRDKNGRDICRGKGKKYTNNGRSWRCKR